MADDKDPNSKDTFNRITNPDGTPVRDKDNAAPQLRPSYSQRPAPNLAPPSMSGIRQQPPRVPVPQQPDKVQFRDNENQRIDFRANKSDLVPQQSGSDRSDDIVVEKQYLTQRTWQKGHISSMPGHSFVATVYDKPSQYGIEGGQISKLEVRHYGQVIMEYDRGWKLPPRSNQDIEAVNRLRIGLEDKFQQHTKAPEQRPDKGHGMDR